MEIRMPDTIRQVIDLLEEAGHEAWLVGGSIRDSLTGKSPKDWDVVTSAGLEVIQATLEGIVRIVPVGVKFGTISLIAPGLKGEISSFRAENLGLDLARRDFTINAMAWHPYRGLQDPHGGKKDLEQGVIRCPGSAGEIFAADPLRMVRAARFAAQLGFAVETETLEAIGRLHALIDEVSAERIREEFSAILVSQRPVVGIELLRETGLLARVLPELEACVGFEQHNPHHNLDVYRHIVETVANTPPDLVLRLAALLHDIGKPQCLTVDEKGIGHFYGHEREGAVLASQIMRRLRYDNETIAKVKKLVREHMLRINYPRMNPAKLLARVGRDYIDSLFSLQEADARAGVDRSIDAIVEMRARVAKSLAEKRPFSRADLKISGRDLQKLDIAHGARIGPLLDKLVVAVIKDPKLNEKSQLIKLAKSITD